MIWDVIIIGGGAAGLMAANRLAGEGHHVLLLEKQDRVGRKLLSTGNGRCNLTNFKLQMDGYHGCSDAAMTVNSLFPPERVCAYFEELGIPVVADFSGRVYPRSNLAASVLDALRLGALERGTEVRTGTAVQTATACSPGFEIQTIDEKIRTRKLLIATGGCAAPKLGGGSYGYHLLQDFGHKLLKPIPALTPLRSDATELRSLKGQRVSCSIRLLANKRTVRTRLGEVLFSETGLSGIAAMELASECARVLSRGETAEASLCLIPVETSSDELLHERMGLLPMRAMEDFLNGLLPRRIGMELVKAAKIPLSTVAGALTEQQVFALARLLKDWRFRLTGVQGFESAQVTSGGIDLDDFNWKTMESVKVPGLYAAGECLDIDGDCGGYNLQWAWASAMVAANGIHSALNSKKKTN